MAAGLCKHCGGRLVYDSDDKCLKCMMCGRPFVAKANTEQVSVVAQPHQESQTRGQTYFDQHRDEILADRLSIGHGLTLTKWKMPLAAWFKFKRQCEEDGVEVPNLTKRNAEVAKANNPKRKIKHIPTVREEHSKAILSSEDKIEITVERLEEILRELEYLRGYKQAVLDILTNNKGYLRGGEVVGGTQ